MPSWKTSRATPNAAAVESRLARVPSSAISGACSATSRSRKPRARITPMTSGVDSSSWVLRSRFSTAAPPTSAESGRSARSRSTVVAERGVGGVDGGDGLDQHVGRCRRRRASAASRRRCPASPASTSAAASASAWSIDDLQGAGGAFAEGVLDEVVADPGGGVLGEHLDRGHRGLQPEDGRGEGEQDDQGGQARSDGALPQPLAPGGELRGAVLAGVRPTAGRTC